MYCVDAFTIQNTDVNRVTAELLRHIDSKRDLQGFWLHFDTDVLSDKINPAVDYRLPGGLSVDEVTLFLQRLLTTQRIAGMSVTIYNPRLDPTGEAGRVITGILADAFEAISTEI